jgi:hypothetical protein
MLLVSQDVEHVPIDPDARLDELTRAALHLADAGNDDWSSEGRGARAQAELARLARLVGADDAEVEAGARISGDFRSDGLRPAELAIVLEDAVVRVRRPMTQGPQEPAGPGAPEAGVREPFLGREGFLRAFAELARPFRGRPRVEFKTYRIEERGPGFESEAFYTASGPSNEGLLQINAVWRCRWEESDAALSLAGVELRDYSEIATLSGKPVLADAPLAGVDPSWLAGIGELRGTLDTRLGLPILGHPAGIAVGDVNGDELEDLYLCQPGGLPNRLLLHGEGEDFVDRSRASGADFLEYSRAALLLDLDGDRDRDLVVSVLDELLFLANDGTGVFAERARIAVPQSTSLAAADFDLDGDLDVYACAYFDPYSDGGAGDEAGVPLPYHDAQNGQPNVLLENSGEFRFADVTAARGLDAGNRRFSFAASWEDYDLDGDPDLYVANDFGRNVLYRNDGGRFVECAAAAGVEDIASGMGVSWGDYDADGWLDVYVSNMFSAAGNRVVYQRRFQPGAADDTLSALRRMARGNTLFRNLGDGTFADVSVETGVTMARWSWGSLFVDVNADGRLDLLAPNGFLTQERTDDL